MDVLVITTLTWWGIAIREALADEEYLEDLGAASRGTLGVWVALGLVPFVALALMLSFLGKDAQLVQYIIAVGICWVIYGLLGLAFHKRVLWVK